MDNEQFLIVSSNEEKLLIDLLRTSRCNLHSMTSGTEARRKISELDYDLIVINTPLSDEFGDDLALQAIDSTTSGVMLVVRSNIQEDVATRMEDYGVMVVGKPINYQEFNQSLKMIVASRRRMLGLKNENNKLRLKIEEIKTVDRAKCLLIQQMKMTESEAHKYIEKQAMSTRRNRKDVAQGILNTMNF